MRWIDSDRVPHQRLIVQLVAVGVRGNILALICNLLTGRTHSFSVRGESLDWLSFHSGVPRGSVVGPILFFINDLVNSLESEASLFVDDVKIYMIIKT